MSRTFKDEPQIHWLPDGKRLQMRHGPIDLVIEAFGRDGEIQKSYASAASAFRTILGTLVGELDLLRKPIGPRATKPLGRIACHMESTTRRIANEQFATPMIAVAGAVADHVLERMTSGCDLTRAYVNNGGDIAIHLSQDESFNIGVCANPLTGDIGSTVHITSTGEVGGVATSGWRGRSHSLGIADAVTVLAHDAASADVAATLIANAVDLPNHPLITRQKASDLYPDSDLGTREVTIAVAELNEDDARRALRAGRTLAQSMIDRGDIISVFARLQTGGFAISPSETLPMEYPSKMNRLPRLEDAHA